MSHAIHRLQFVIISSHCPIPSPIFFANAPRIFVASVKVDLRSDSNREYARSKPALSLFASICVRRRCKETLVQVIIQWR